MAGSLGDMEQGGPGAAGDAVRLARFLSLDAPDGFSDVTLARRVADGLPVKSANGLAELIGRTHVIGPVIPEPTLRRAQKGRKPLSREHSERLYELSRVLDALSRIYRGDRERMIGFMTRPHPLLGGETPLDVTRLSSAGADAVLNLLRRADAGVAV